MRADEWLVPAGEGRNLTRDEMREALSADPEVTLISDFLAGELSPDEALAVEARLRDDEAFRRHVTPVIEAWKAWPSSRDVAVPEHEMAASWQRFLAKAAWKEKAAEAASVQRPADPPRDARAPYRVRRWQLAAALLVIVGFPLSGWMGVRIANRLEGPRVRVAEASGREWESIRLGSDSWVSLPPGSRLEWKDEADGYGIRELILDGSARFRLQPLPTGQYVVVTPSARITVTGTEFEVDVRDPSTTRVHVTHGRVRLESRGARTGIGIELTVGESGEAFWGEPPRRAR